MRIIITGGTGLIGRALSADLIADGHEVIVLSRDPGKAAKMPAGTQVEKWDAVSAAGWGHLADGADAIVNLAGASVAGEHFLPSRWTKKRKRIIADSRINAGKAVVEAVAAASVKPRVVIQSSAIGYYGARDDKPVDEQTARGDDFLAQLCVDWEASTAAVEDMQVRRVVIRTGLVLSMEGGAFTRLLLPFKLFAGGYFGNGRQYYSWVHIADQVAAIRFLIENEETHGVYNVSAPRPQTNREFGKTLGRVMRRPAFMPVPGFVMRLMFGEVSMAVLEGQRVLSKRLQEAGFSFKFPESEAAFRDLLKKG